MGKYVLFTPEHLCMNEEPDESCLWKVDYKIKTDENRSLNVYICNLDLGIMDTYPLSYLEKNMDEMGMEKIYDFPFCKEYIFTDNLGLTFIATLTALDMNGSKNSLKLKKKFAELIIQDLDLPREGKMHPEKFLRRLSSKLDFSEKKYEAYDKNFDTLLELENLCSKCLQYETNLEWKIINEEFN